MPPIVPMAMTINDLSLRASYLKCFSLEPVGFNVIKPINIAIGRNNSGKSTLLDLVEYAAKPFEDFNKFGRGSDSPKVYIDYPITDDTLGQINEGRVEVRFPPNNSVHVDPRDWAKKVFSDFKVRCILRSDGKLQASSVVGYTPRDPREVAYLDAVLKAVRFQTYFDKYQVRRILADRDIRPEGQQQLSVASNGTGVTNFIRAFLTTTDFNPDFAEREILDGLNLILGPDVKFSKIRAVQDEKTQMWEIHLHEDSKGRIPLSLTGSGIKTVLFVLTCVRLLPHYENRHLNDYLFAFEELENNLHPAAQRRLFRFLREKAEKESCHFFITTHSNVVIDLFAHDEMSQIIHVTHDGTNSKVERHSSTSHGWAILDDLDIRASDILQSNAIVWVEGPSDRTYLNHWISLYTNGELQEGVHYQCLFYGGAIGTHFSLDDPDEVTERIEAMKLNRHAIFVTDCDRDNKDDDLKEYAGRLIGEANEFGGYGFATAGRTIENYIPTAVWRQLSGDPELAPPALYEQAIEYAHANLPTKDTKVKLAKKAVALFTYEMIENNLDLQKQLQEICSRISDWNKLPVLTPMVQTASA